MAKIRVLSRLLLVETRMWSHYLRQKKGVVRLLVAKTRAWSHCLWQKQGCGQAAFGKNKGVVRLHLARTRKQSGCIKQEPFFSQAASGENKGVVRLHLYTHTLYHAPWFVSYGEGESDEDEGMGDERWKSFTRPRA